MKTLKKFLIFIGSILALTVLTRAEDWTSYKAQFRLKFTNALEDARREINWLNNFKKVDKHNKEYAEGKQMYKMSMNKFSHLSYDEVIASFTGYLSIEPKALSSAVSSTLTKLLTTPTTLKPITDPPVSTSKTSQTTIKTTTSFKNQTTITSPKSTTTTTSQRPTTTTTTTTTIPKTSNLTSLPKTTLIAISAINNQTTTTSSKPSTTTLTSPKSTTSSLKLTTTSQRPTTTIAKTSNITSSTKTTLVPISAIANQTTTTTSSRPTTTVTKSGSTTSSPKTTTTTILSLPNGVDWRNTNLVGPNVLDQGACGCCYAFSGVGALEGQQAKKYGKYVDLSEQQFVSCTPSNQGCTRGDVVMSYRNILSAGGGVNTEVSYPYKSGRTNIAGNCSFNNVTIGTKMTGYVTGNGSKTVAGSETWLQYAVANIGPISACFYVSSGFMSYSGGIFSESKCTTTLYNSMNHCVLVVGYGTENGVPYWILKNQWGIDWGEKGYMRLLRNSGNQICIASKTQYPLVA